MTEHQPYTSSELTNLYQQFKNRQPSVPIVARLINRGEDPEQIILQIVELEGRMPANPDSLDTVKEKERIKTTLKLSNTISPSLYVLIFLGIGHVMDYCRKKLFNKEGLADEVFSESQTRSFYQLLDSITEDDRAVLLQITKSSLIIGRDRWRIVMANDKFPPYYRNYADLMNWNVSNDLLHLT